MCVHALLAWQTQTRGDPPCGARAVRAVSLEPIGFPTTGIWQGYERAEVTCARASIGASALADVHIPCETHLPSRRFARSFLR